MGIYINPSNTSKEIWLETHSKPMQGNTLYTVIREYDEIRKKKLIPICLVDNGPFTAAAVIQSKEQAVAFASFDGRQKQWFLVPLTALNDNSGIASKILETI